MTAIKPVQRSEQVRLQLEHAIRQGDFSPGERLPSERELVGTFGVSRVSVRDAIGSLETLGLVRVQQGRGAFVTDRRSGLGEPMARWLEMHRDEVLELHRVRGALDELAAESAAELGDRALLDAVVQASEAFRSAVERKAETEELVLLDIDFHVAIGEASGIRLLYDLLFDLHRYLAESRRFVFSSPQRLPNSVREHARMVDRMLAGDPSGARSASARHVRSVRKLVAAAAGANV